MRIVQVHDTAHLISGRLTDVDAVFMRLVTPPLARAFDRLRGTPSAEPMTYALEIKAGHRGRTERQDLGDEQTADDGDAQRRLGPCVTGI
jgi:hypothetical protein